MAKRKSSSKQRAQGGGRAANSEPRLQVYKDFAGCNFQLSPRDFSLGSNDEEQSDLQMNYVVVQNNAFITDNKTVQTRNNIKKIFDAPEGKRLTDASVLVGRELYIGCDDGSLVSGIIGTGTLNTLVKLEDKATNRLGTHWESLTYVDDKIVGTTEENQLWTGTLGTHKMSNAIKVPDPSSPTIDNIVSRGTLKISSTMTDECCFRVAIAWSYINKYGPTKCSPQFSFYANTPVSEWHSGCFAQITGTAPTGYDIKAVEIYYNVGNASSLQFAGRTDFPGEDGGKWNFDWIGYLDVTSMWPMANLLSPTENVTEGVKASHVTCIDSRLYFWGSKDEPQRLWIGGNPGNLFSVSPGTGGGFVDVEPGTGQEIRVVCKYKTQSGNSIVTMLCDSDNSTREQRFNLVENTVTISNEQNMKSWQAEQVSGAVGCKSYHGAQVCEDGLYSVSRYGLALTTMTMEYNSQIRTNYVSNQIKPIFTDPLGANLSNSILLESDGILYMAFGKNNNEIDNLLFCYDVSAKAWWTYSLDVDEPIIDLIHIDWEGHQEGIGLVTPNAVYLLPTTQDDKPTDNATFDTLIVTGELANQQPQQGWQYIAQMEFHFDYIVGDLDILVEGIDQFGRRIRTVKHIHKPKTQYGYVEWMRIDLRLQSYKITMSGKANFRMTHFIGKCYVMSNRIGMVYGWDDEQTFRNLGDIHPTFRSYNDIRTAIIT